MYKILLSLMLSALLLCSCSNDDTMLIGTFNIAWLGDGQNDKIIRSESDYKNIAAIIKSSGADVLTVQEIENEEALELLMSYMPDYKYLLGKNGAAQNVGVIFKNTIDVVAIGEYMPVAVKVGETRPGFVCKCKKGQFDWLMMVVHLKSTSRYDSTAELKEESYQLRQQQAKVVSLWADSVLSHSTEKDIMILGDFNDNPKRKRANLEMLVNDTNLTFITTELKSCKNRIWDGIDHIVVSDEMKKRVQHNGLHTYNFFEMFTDIEVKMISDHCPVLVPIDISNLNE